MTAGNSCGVSDGAGAVALVPEAVRAELGLAGIAVRAHAVCGVDPRLPGLGPVPAVRAVLRAAGLTLADVGTVEMTEAFASQVLACTDALDLDVLGTEADPLCPDGGAIALGHRGARQRCPADGAAVRHDGAPRRAPVRAGHLCRGRRSGSRHARGARRMIELGRRHAPVRGPGGADDISLRLPQRRIGVIGANGSGKSTLARLLNGLVVPTRGRVLVAGHDTRRDGAAVRRRVGFVFTDPDAQIVMPTVAEDVAFSLRRRHLSTSERDRRVREVLERFGIAEHADHPAHLLSGGQKQLLALAAVLVTEPELLVCDEPTTLLDLRNTDRVAALLGVCRSRSCSSPTTSTCRRVRPRAGRRRRQRRPRRDAGERGPVLPRPPRAACLTDGRRGSGCTGRGPASCTGRPQV